MTDNQFLWFLVIFAAGFSFSIAFLIRDIRALAKYEENTRELIKMALDQLTSHSDSIVTLSNHLYNLEVWKEEFDDYEVDEGEPEE